jgi:hypothetical protein
MKLTIDLAEIQGFEDETIATTIKLLIDEEIQKFIRSEVRAELKKNEKNLKEIIQKAVNKDPRKIAKLLGLEK